MLYVFQMDVGQMLTFDISFLMDSVSRLQQEIARVTGIAVDQQILLLSGGHSLHPDQKVMTYGAGADTNPVFLFSKLAITSQEPPLVKSFGVPRDVLGALKNKVLESLKLPVAFDTVVTRTKVAVQIRDSAAQILKFCNNEFKEQHLQHQGWSAVVANLEEIAQALQKTRGKFSKVFSSFLPLRDKYFASLSDFEAALELLSRIPILQSLKDSDVVLDGDDEIEVVKKSLEQESRSLITSTPSPGNLLEWITTQGQGQSIEGLQLKCYNELVMFNEEMFDAYEAQVVTLLDQVTTDPNQMKELVGIERRLSDLEKRLNEAKKIAKAQHDLAQGFLHQQSRLNSTPDSSLLPDLCTSHKRQLQQMWDGQQRIEALQNNFRKSKQEMSTNIHQRLGWVVHIETQISQLDSELIFHMKTLKILEMNLDILGQVKAAPRVYADMIMEAARRRQFSQIFTEWASGLVEDSRLLYEKEIERRTQFITRHGNHFFLHTLFRGFEDMPPNFATKPPAVFDASLPSISQEEITSLKTSVPELEESLSVHAETSVFPEYSLTKRLRDSPFPHIDLPNSQSSQTEWTQVGPVQPCVITATEAPATAFTLPDMQESRATEYLPAVSSLTDTMRDVMAPQAITKSRAASVQSQADEKDFKSLGSDPPSISDASNRHGTKTSPIPTDSTSPLSSNEFATADFYFEDSMPSPMKSKSDSETISTLQADLLEKSKRIQELESLVKSKGFLSDVVAVASKENMSDESSSVTLVAQSDGSEHVVTSHSSETDNIEIVALEHVTNKQQFQEERDKLKKELANIEKSVAEKDKQIDGLNKIVEMFKEDLAKFKDESEEKDSLCAKTKEELEEARKNCESLTKDMKQGDERLCRVKNRLEVFKQEAKNQLPIFRRTLDELRLSVLNNKTEVDTAVVSLMGQVESKVNKFNCTILAEVNQAFQSEKDSLIADIHRLEAELCAIQKEKSMEVMQLSQRHEEFTSKASQREQELQRQLDDQKVKYESMLKEAETKHLLELEIELDKCRTDFTKQVEEQDRNVESLNQMKEDLLAELEKVKGAADRNLESHSQAQADLIQELDKVRARAESERAELEKAHKQRMSELEKKLRSESEEAAKRLTQFEAEVEEKLTSGNLQIEQLLSQLEALEKSMAEEKHLALQRQKSDLTEEKDIFLSKQKEEMMSEMAAALEKLHQELSDESTLALQKQKDESQEEKQNALEKQKQELTAIHETELDLLKTQLLKEKESSLQQQKQELSEAHLVELTDLEQRLKEDHKEGLTKLLEDKQLEYAEKLTELKVQFDIEREKLQKELSQIRDHVMTNSETQTGMELLAEVISLTSSASYGSEEMIANRQLPSLGDEKENLSETSTKMQQTIDDLTSQLKNAHETITSLNTELTNVRLDHEALKSQCLSDREESAPNDLRASMYGTDSEPYMMTQSTMSENTSSFILMDQSPEKSPAYGNELRIKDEKIAQLEKKVMEMSITTMERELPGDKVSIKGCDKGDLVLLCLDERHNQYVVFTVGTNLHFLHSESLEGLGLKSDTESKKTWILAEVVDKEYCLAKKPNNRFRVPQGTCFYRVKCKPWNFEIELTKSEREMVKHGKTPRLDPSKGAKHKKTEKK